MKNIQLDIKTKTQNYSMIIGSYLTREISKIFEDYSIMFKNCLMVIDKKVPKKKVLEIKKSLKKKNILIFSLKACL